MSALRLFNRQKTRAIHLPLLRQIIRSFLADRSYELAIHLIDATEMARLNEDFLQHTGSTDVITFDYQEQPKSESICGEIFISLDDAVLHARRFRTTWQSELIRYIVHGVLHLEGHDDLAPGPRRAMKREENRLLKDLSRRFKLGTLGRTKNGA